RLRVTVQLVDSADGYQRWSQRFDGAIADVFAIQDEIAAGVAAALRGLRDTGDQLQWPRVETTPEAYEHFLRGRRLLRLNTLSTRLICQRELERAIELDPGYAPAHALLAQLHAVEGEWNLRAEARVAAEVASQRAIELGPELAETHVARAGVLAMC